MDKDEKRLRIGVFVCHCGFNIGGVVDVPAVVDYARKLSDVVWAEGDMYTCSSSGLSSIRERIREQDLNRVIVASCTPATHEQLFRRTCEQAGLNKYLFEMVNIREHSSWVHMRHRREATEKAKDLIRMAVAKARFLKPQTESELEINRSSLVVGGGISGMAAAKSLAEQGFNVHLVEKESELGGTLRKLHRLEPTGQDSSEVLSKFVSAVLNNKRIHVHTSTLVDEVEGFIGNFTCTLLRSHAESVEEIKVGTIVVATGAEALQPTGMYCYGETDRVVTQLELEGLMRRRELGKPRNIVMIQCVGARERTGRTYCSRICCMVALNNALLLKEVCPDAEVTIIFRDMQAYGKYEPLYREARANFISFLRYDQDRPPRVSEKADGNLRVIVFDEYLGADVEIDTDLLVLSTPLVQHEDGKALSNVLKVPLGSDGFFFEAHPKLRPVDFTSDGIYVCGTAHGPKDVPESLAQSYAAASRAGTPMALGRMAAGAVKAVVDKDICVNCDACVVSCIFNAIEAEPFGLPHIVEANCKGCGVCAAECPMGAMQLVSFTDEQIVAAIKALFEHKQHRSLEVVFEPLVLCFACQWCSYGAADLAGVSRIQYPPNIRILRVPCSGRVDVLHVVKAFKSGADGIIITGCHIGDCHYIDGNLKAKDRVEALKKSLGAFGVDPRRIEIGFASSSEGQRFATMMTDFVEKIRGLGPNPLTVARGAD